MASPATLSPVQAHALFDILTHHEAYTEIRNLKDPQAIATFGAPLQAETPSDSSSPLIQILLQKFILTVLPGLRDVPSDFWTTNIKGLATALDDANLSESYDKGSIGIRKTLATAIASIVEYVARGVLGGYAKNLDGQERDYDPNKPDDVIAAWDRFLQGIIYENGLDKMFAKAKETDRLEDHESLIQAAHEYVIVIFASFLHYILIISPRGQSILPLLTKAHNLSPYFLIRQTLRVGNAASMLNGMVKLILAKMNMSTITSWFGGQVSDSGMNLLQQIISQVLASDSSELKKRAKAIEQDKDAPAKEHLAYLREYGTKSAEEQQSIRTFSETTPDSITSAILSTNPDLASLNTHQQTLPLDYLAIQLAIRDREQLIKVLCHSSPDLLTSSIRSIIPAYDPIIRGLHSAVDLSSGVSDLEAFLNDLIKVSTIEGKGDGKKTPTVEDYCKLMQKHQGSSHRFIHQVLKNGKDLSQWYYEYAMHAAKQYRQETSPDIDNGTGVASAGDFTGHLSTLVSSLEEKDRATIIAEIDAHAAYLSSLTKSSTKSMHRIVSNLTENTSTTTTQGPGAYLSRWQSFMDSTPITPLTSASPIRSGKSASVRDATVIDIDGEKKGDTAAVSRDDAEGGGNGDVEVADAPEVKETVRLLGEGFKGVLRGMVV